MYYHIVSTRANLACRRVWPSDTSIFMWPSTFILISSAVSPKYMVQKSANSKYVVGTILHSNQKYTAPKSTQMAGFFFFL